MIKIAVYECPESGYAHKIRKILESQGVRAEVRERELKDDVGGTWFSITSHRVCVSWLTTRKAKQILVKEGIPTGTVFIYNDDRRHVFILLGVLLVTAIVTVFSVFWGR